MSENPGNVELLPDLLARCRRGDRPAFDTLVRRFHAYAFSLATALVPTRDEADDAVQSAFVTVLTRVPDLRTPDAFPGWLRQIVRTECNRLTRGQRTTAIHDTLPSPSSPPPDAVEHQELRTQIRRAVSDLPPAQREAAELFYLDELSQSDVARTLSIPEGTVKRRLFDARNTLRTTLKSQIPI
jgi:RNA polymerase sigma factor (sigma-70 family)